MSVKVRTKMVFDRDMMGRFAERCDRAASETVQDLINMGARTSRSLAPSSGENVASYSRRPGYVPLKRSIRTSRVGTGKRGWWYSIAPHAMYVEKDTKPHLIYGRLSFPWNGGEFYWHDFAWGPVSSSASGPHSIVRSGHYRNWDKGGAWVLHPGTSAQPFLRPAYDRVVKRQAMEVAARNYPG